MAAAALRGLQDCVVLNRHPGLQEHSEVHIYCASPSDVQAFASSSLIYSHGFGFQNIRSLKRRKRSVWLQSARHCRSLHRDVLPPSSLPISISNSPLLCAHFTDIYTGDIQIGKATRGSDEAVVIEPDDDLQRHKSLSTLPHPLSPSSSFPLLAHTSSPSQCSIFHLKPILSLFFEVQKFLLLFCATAWKILEQVSKPPNAMGHDAAAIPCAISVPSSPSALLRAGPDGTAAAGVSMASYLLSTSLQLQQLAQDSGSRSITIPPVWSGLRSNPTFMSALVAWAFAQTLKVLTKYAVEKQWDWKALFGSGGMPSSHSALCMALTTSVAILHGIAGPLFPVCLGFSLIVMYDATGVRYHAGMQAEVLNVVVAETLAGHPVSEKKLKELLGHTPLQVAVGAIWGAAVSAAYHLLCHGT
eukprot:TRINITY_DN7593_c0_g1_i4.p1 TRINITY_DN7593_c0_g1~~TRINITY_DN7593_c0_g1_i4.p1  ORF type:complete len:432 (+),score=66.15 TRINITY_DN7593_c0_g1_i4:52-1296(+)